MVETSCEVVFRGKMLAGFERERVRENLSQLLGLGLLAVDAMLDAPKTVIRSGIGKDEASRLRESLLRAGIMVAVITQTGSPTSPPPSIPSAPTASAPPAAVLVRHVVAAHEGPSELVLANAGEALAERREFAAPKVNLRGIRITKSSEHVAAQPAPAQVIKELDLTVAEVERKDEKVMSPLIQAITKDSRRP